MANEELDDEMLEFEERYGKKKENTGGKGMKTVVIVLSVIAGILAVILAYTLISNLKLIDELNIDKENLTTELITLQSEYDSLSTSNLALSDSLSVEKEKVGQLIERLQKTEATNRAKIRQYEKELGTLRSIMKSYIRQIDSLNTLNTELRNEAVEARRDAAVSKRKYEELVSTTDDLRDKANAGAVLKGRGVTLTAINASAKETDRSSRTIKLKVCTSLIENAIARRGDRKVYVKIFGPDGRQMASAQQEAFTFQGENMMSSSSRVVDYQGEEIEICIYFIPSEVTKFSKGVYTAEVYTNEAKLGTAELLLR